MVSEKEINVKLSMPQSQSFFTEAGASHVLAEEMVEAISKTPKNVILSGAD